MNSLTSWLLLIVEALGYSSVMFSAYVVSYIYVLFQSATGFSPAQLGQIAGVVGTVALLGYIFGGILADLVSTKKLLVMSHCTVPLLVLYLSTFPSHNTFMVVQALLGFIAIFLYWTPVSNFVRSLGTSDNEGKRFGYFFAMVSIGGTLVGLMAVFLTSKMDGMSAMRIVYYYFALINIIDALFLAWKYNPDNNEQMSISIDSNENKFKIDYIVNILSMPSIWLIGIMGFAGYMTGKLMVYITPYLQESYGLSLSTATLINAVVNYGVAIFMSPLAGMLTDRARSASKVLLYMLVIFSVILISLLLIPAKAAFTPILIVIAVLIAACFSIDQTNWFTPLSEIPIPPYAKGTATGIASLMMFSSDAFAYNLFGGFLDHYGTSGYRMIFSVTLAICMIGIISTLLLRKRIAEHLG